MRTYGKWITLFLAILSLALLLGGCGGSSGSGGQSSATGLAKLDLTDAPASDYAHVYVTVTGVAFHTQSTAAFADYSSGRRAGWQVINLPTPKTVDLAQLNNGTMYADLNGNDSLFSGITLPVGQYRQIRLFLASTEDAYTGSVSGLTYNNEVQLNDDATHYPLRLPSASTGIKLVPESPVQVTSGGSVSLALDFNLSEDVVKVSPNGTTEFILKPRLGYFDMGSVAAIKGAVSFGNLSTSRIEVKAEQVKSGTHYRVVRRMTGVDRNDGSFKLYPLPIFGNATTATYDLLIRGRNVRTAIIKGITVHKGTNLANGVDLGSIELQQGSEFSTQLGTGMHPSGAWMNFYQNVSGDSSSYEVTTRHLDPYTGRFGSAVSLSSDPILIATYTPGQPLVFVEDTSNQGTYSTVADAASAYGRGSRYNGLHGSRGQSVTMNLDASNYPQAADSGTITSTFETTGGGMGGRNHGMSTSGQLFITSDGLIIDSVGTTTGDSTVTSAMNGGSGSSISVSNLPTGSMYGLYALGWGSGSVQTGSAHGISLSGRNASATVRMR